MKKNYIYILLFIILIAGFAGYAILKPESLPASVSNTFKPTSKVTVTVATPTDDYVEVKATSTRKIIWEALGFEPGFAFKVFSEMASGTEQFSANIVTQDNELFSGFLVAQGTGTSTVYTSTLSDINSKKESKINISFSEKACTKPDGTPAKFTSTLKIGTRTMTGCADKFN